MHRVISSSAGLALAGMVSGCGSLKEIEIGTCVLNDDGTVANPTDCGCANGIDDDENGGTDCGFPEFAIPGDVSCITSPVCTGKPGTGDGPSEVGDPLAPNLKSFSMTYIQYFELTGLGLALCGPNGFLEDCGCRGVWQGNGTLRTAEDDHNTYDGEWKKVEDDCKALGPGQPSFSSTVWLPDDGQAFHTHWFLEDRDGSLGFWAQWTVHGNESRYDPDFDNPMRSLQFYALADQPPEMVPTADGYEVDYEENRTFNAGPGVDVKLDSRWIMSFSESPTPPELPSYPPRDTGDTGDSGDSGNP